MLSFKGQEKYKTYAAADFALMPSRYEPCGLVQMEGMRFGVLPIVAPTGGLADTVQDLKVRRPRRVAASEPFPLRGRPLSRWPRRRSCNAIRCAAAVPCSEHAGPAFSWIHRTHVRAPLIDACAPSAQTGLVLERELDMDDIVPADVALVADGIKRAVKLYGDKGALRAIQVAAMKAAKDYSWTKATKEYVQHFLVRPPRTPHPPPLPPSPPPPPLSIFLMLARAPSLSAPSLPLMFALLAFSAPSLLPFPSRV